MRLFREIELKKIFRNFFRHAYCIEDINQIKYRLSYNGHEADLDSGPDCLTTNYEIKVMDYVLFLIKTAIGQDVY